MSLDTNFKELVPEFFFSDGDFLVNNDKLGFDVNTEGDFIEDVILPKWANVRKYIRIFCLQIIIFWLVSFPTLFLSPPFVRMSAISCKK